MSSCYFASIVTGQVLISQRSSRIHSPLHTLWLLLGGRHRNRWEQWHRKEYEGQDFHALPFQKSIAPWGENDLQPVFACNAVWTIWKYPNGWAVQFQGHEDDLEGGHWGGRNFQFKIFGFVIVKLGWQGNTRVLLQVWYLISWYGKDYFVLILSEIFPRKLSLFPDADV